jgi:Zn-dependent peptidase ImmA (M78 family)
MDLKYLPPSVIESIADNIRHDNPSAVSYDGDLETVDIYQLAKSLGCKVEEVGFTPDTVSARVLRSSGSRYAYTIQVARQDSTRRQKFSIAHEISHIVLHDDGQSEFVELRQSIDNYDQETLFKETQANMLAAALLLPGEQVRKAWRDTKSVDQVADIFDVSITATYNRLSNLNLLFDE